MPHRTRDNRNLAAYKESDVAILRLKDAKGLAAAPVFRDEPVGQPATIISNPTGRFFTLSHGRVSRYHVSLDGVCFMNITADYAKGSSGGPIFNDRGDVIGLVANTVSIPYRHVPLHVDEESKALKIANKRADSTLKCKECCEGELGACEHPYRSKRLSCDETNLQTPNSGRTLQHRADA